MTTETATGAPAGDKAEKLPSIRFNHDKQHFESTSPAAIQVVVNGMTKPLSLTFQLTRACNFKCIYCSEPPGIRSLPLEQLKGMIDRLAGMRRIILSGGEPMAYRHFWEILEYARERFEIVVLSTNASRITHENAQRLKELVDYVDVTVDGPRRQHNAIRGHYDAVMHGLMHVASARIPLSVICVYLPGNQTAMHYIAQTADAIGAIKMKILTPIPKGMSKGLFEGFVSQQEIERLREFLDSEKRINGWQTRITISDWMRIGRGHAILVEPDGRMVASPDWVEEDCVLEIGNLATETAEALWQKYPYKENHLNKYLENSLIVA